MMQYWLKKMRINCLPQIYFFCFCWYRCYQNKNLIALENEVFLEGKQELETTLFFYLAIPSSQILRANDIPPALVMSHIFWLHLIV